MSIPSNNSSCLIRINRMCESAKSTVSAVCPVRLINACDSLKTICCSGLKTTLALTAGFVTGGIIGSCAFQKIEGYKINSAPYNETSTTAKDQAEVLSAFQGFIFGGVIGMTSVAVHRGANLVKDALQGYRSVPHHENVECAYENPIYSSEELTTI